MTNTTRSRPIADWWWYTCISVAWIAGMLGLALDLYYRHFFVWPESRMEGRVAAMVSAGELGALVSVGGLSLVFALPALDRHRFRWQDLVAVAVPTTFLLAVVVRM